MSTKKVIDVLLASIRNGVNLFYASCMPIPISNNQFLKASYMARQQRLYNALLGLSIARTILFGIWATKSDTCSREACKSE